MNHRNRSHLDLSFDSLTDVVTNLVGGLILLIVVVMGMTTPRIGGVRALPPPDNQPGAEQPMNELLDRIRALQESLRVVEQDITQVEARLPELSDELGELKHQIGLHAPAGGQP